MNDTIAAYLDQLDQLILHGSIAEAGARIEETSPRKIPRKQVARLAGLARRAYLPERSLRLLHGIIRPSTGRRVSAEGATDREKAEYACALVYVGGCREALELLGEVNAAELPAAHLYRGFAHLRTWDFEAAIRELEAYIAHPRAEAIGRLRSRLELAGALIDFRHDFKRTDALLAELQKECGPGRYRTIYKDVLLVTTQNLAAQGKWLETAAPIAALNALNAEDRDPVFRLLTRKWDAITRLATAREETRSLRTLHRVRDQLTAAKRFEDARACDYYEGLIRQDRELLLQVYHGSPYTPLRHELSSRLGLTAEERSLYERSLGQGHGAPVTLDVTTGNPSSAPGAQLKEGDIAQRALQALALDFYRPPRTAELHEKLYPNEHFNPDSSPDKIHQALRTLRRWLEENRVPLEIHEDRSFYRLAATAPLLLTLRTDREEMLKLENRSEVRLRSYLERLGQRFSQNDFSAAAAGSALGLPARTAVRYLAAARDQGLVKQVRFGPRTHYRLTG